MAHIRGSPFVVESADPWQERHLGGAAPAKRAGATLSSVGSDLVLFGGDKSLAAVCHALSGDEPWQWFPTSEGDAPLARKGHAAAAVPGSRQLVVCGGQALDGEPCNLADVRQLASHGSSFAGTSWRWQPAGSAMQLHQRADGSQVPSERSGHCAVMIGSTLLAFGGEHDGQLLQELCLADLSSKVPGALERMPVCVVDRRPPHHRGLVPLACAAVQAAPCWVEPEADGELPCARKGAAAAVAGEGFAVIFGGAAVDGQGEELLLDDLYVVQVEGLSRMRCSRQQASGAAPPPRTGALLQEHGPGKLLLYGGTGPGHRALGDAWVLDVAALTWQCLYDGDCLVRALAADSRLRDRRGASAMLARGMRATIFVAHRRRLWQRCMEASWCAWRRCRAAAAWTWRAPSIWSTPRRPCPLQPRCAQRL